MTASITNVRFLALLVLVLPIVYSTTTAQTISKQKRSTAVAQTTARATAEFDEEVKRADEARTSGRLDDAVKSYTRALRLRPKWPDGWWYLGAIFYEKDLYVEARDAFNNLVALEPGKGQAWGMLGLCEYQTADYERAVTSLQRGRTLGLGGNQELETVVRYHTALLYIHFGQFEIGYEILREFLRVGNDSPKIVEAFGLTLLRMPLLPKEIPTERREQVMLAGQAGLNMAARHLDQARKEFDALLSRYPDEPNVHYSFGVFLINQDADAALKEFQRTLELSPSHQPAMVQMAFEYLKRDDFNTALPLAEKAVQLAPRMFPARNVLGRVLLELGQLDRAIRELEEGVRLAPDSPEMHYALGRAYRRAGREAAAKREVALFQKLQEEFNTRRNAQLTGSQTGANQTKVQP